MLPFYSNPAPTVDGRLKKNHAIGFRLVTVLMSACFRSIVRRLKSALIKAVTDYGLKPVAWVLSEVALLGDGDGADKFAKPKCKRR